MASLDVDTVKDGQPKTKKTESTPKTETNNVSNGVDPVRNGQTETKIAENKPTPGTKRASNGVDIKKLLEAGAHFGHKTSRWHPKMAPYIHSKRGGSHIIDLTKTVERLETALDFLEQTSAAGKQVLLVSTKRQAKDIVREMADKTNMPYVVERWLGGMLTNRNTIGGRIKYLKDLEARMENGQLANKYGKLEVQRYQEEIDEMNNQYGGIKELAARPGAVFIIDISHDSNAVREARKLGLPIVALVDTNTDPSLIDYPIPCNDDAIKTIQLIADYVEQAILAGKAKHAKKSEKTSADPDKNSQNSNGASKDEKGGEK